MFIHAIIHAPFERLGAIENWINKNNHSLSITHSYLQQTLPTVNQFDFLILMGGPQNILTLDEFPYLKDEIVLIKKAIQANKIILGVCLGAQLISHSLGATPENSPHTEIGVYPIEVTKEGEADPVFKQFPTKFDAMHWHNDMPGIADGCVLLAKSAGCPRQAFRYGDRVYGLQFHLEMTTELVKEMIYHSEELRPGQFIQPASELMQVNLQPINEKIHLTLDYLASLK